MKVALYARVASSEPGGRPLASQIEGLREWAVAHGHAVVKEYQDDGISGRTLNRPGLRDLREAAAAGRFGAVLATGPYRLTRNLEDAARLLGELKANGVRVLFAEAADGEVPSPAPIRWRW